MSALMISFLIYLGIVLVIGVLSALKTESQSEYLLGGQQLPAWAIAISERASGESAWLLLGLTGAALTVGLGEIWTVIGIVAGVFFIWFFVGARLRELMDDTDALTVPELLAQCTTEGKALSNGQGAALRSIASLTIGVFFTFYVAAQMAGAGKVFVQTGLLPSDLSLFGMSASSAGLVIGAVVVVGYTLLGGFGAVVWTDLIQGGIMIIALVVLPVIALMSLNQSDTTLAEALAAAGPEQGSWFGGKSAGGAVLLVLNGLSWGLGYMGMPHLLVRFMAMPSAEGIRQNQMLAATWTVLAYCGAFGIGFMALMLFGQAQLQDPETVMPLMATTLLPGWLAGIVVAGAVAAMMSTADSQLLVVTSAVSEDCARRVLGFQLSESQQVWLSRSVVLVVGVSACLFAWSSEQLVNDLVSFSWSGLGASFGPLILLLMIHKRLPAMGMIAMMLSGSLATFAWRGLAALEIGFATALSERLAAWLLALMVGLWFCRRVPSATSQASMAV